MGEHGPGLIVEAINEIYDNIWLGDWKTADRLARSSLEEIRKQLDISYLVKTAIDVRRILLDLRKEARDEGIENRRLWVADRLSKEIEEKQLDPVKNILGVLALHLTRLGEAVSYLIQAQSQRTMKDFAEKDVRKERVFQSRDKYRYAVQSLPDRSEVHAVLDMPAKAWNLKKLGSRLLQYDLIMEEISKKTFSSIFELYSTDMYIRVLGSEKRVDMLVHAPKTREVEKRIVGIVETILDSITTDSTI